MKNLPDILLNEFEVEDAVFNNTNEKLIEEFDKLLQERSQYHSDLLNFIEIL